MFVDSFKAALMELKYTGFLQGTRASTFIFRRNYFGKRAQTSTEQDKKA